MLVKNVLTIITVAVIVLGLFYTTVSSQETQPEQPQSISTYLPLVIKGGVSPSVPKYLNGVEMTGYIGDAHIQLATNSSTGIVRINALLWSSVETTEGVYDWSQVKALDNKLKRLANANIEVLLIVRGTPSWAQQIPGTMCGPILQQKLQSFANFMGAAVARYSSPPYNVNYWQIWNEPDVDYRYVSSNSPYGCLADADTSDTYYGGEYYTDILKAVYPKIKNANINAQVVIGGLLMGCEWGKSYCSYHQSKYLEGVLRHYGANDGKNYFDLVAFHAYNDYCQYRNPDPISGYAECENNKYIGWYGNYGWQSFWDTTGPVMVQKARYLKNILSLYGAADKGLIATEAALRCGPGVNSISCTSYQPEFELTKAYYVTQTYGAAIAEGLAGVIWFSLAGDWRETDLVNPTDLSILPAYTAYSVANRSLNDASFVREVTDYPGVKAFEYLSAGKKLWLLWSLDGNSHSVNLPLPVSLAWDALGVPLSIAGTFHTITIKPIYIEFQ